MPPSTPPPEDAWDLLSPRLTARRRSRILEVARQRTRHLRLVVQDIHDPHNVSACMRSADAFGILDVDVVTMTETFRPSTVARGVVGWLNWNRHGSVGDCVASLRQGGFRIAAGLPDPDGVSLYDLPVDHPLAVVFGNEHAGIHPDWWGALDLKFTIPMVGMVESLNISVSAAITLAHLSHRARATLGDKNYGLNPQETKDLLNEWICRQTPSWEMELQRRREEPHSPSEALTPRNHEPDR